MEKEKELLVPFEEYTKSGIHTGTRVIMPGMKKYVYRRRPDGIAIFNTSLIDERLKLAASFLASYLPKEIIIVCKREEGWHAVQKFSEIMGIRIFTKKYSSGIITNPSLKDFFQPSLVFICDHWLDKNALNDSVKARIPVIALSNSNNITGNDDFVIPCNNKSSSSIGLIFYILAKEYCKIKNIDKHIELKDFLKEEIK